MNWIGAGVFLSIGIGYLILLDIRMGWQRARRWIQHDPVCGLFLPFIFPIIIGKYFTFVRWSVIDPRQGITIIACDVVLVALIVLGAILTLRNAADSRSVPAPYLLTTREGIEAADDNHLANIEWLKRVGPTPLLQNAAIEDYRKLFQQKWRKPGLVARFDIGMNLIVVICSVFMVWYLMPLVVIHKELKELDASAPSSLVLCAVLVGFWYPLRLYADWYLNFFSFKNIPPARLAAFWTLLLLYLEGLALVFATVHLAKFPLTIAALQAGTAVLLGLVNVAKPGAVRALVFGWVEAPFGYYCAVVLIGVVVCLTLFLGGYVG